jgi:cobalt-zinc-cadmium efflux system outer membrane protein
MDAHYSGSMLPVLLVLLELGVLAPQRVSTAPQPLTLSAAVEQARLRSPFRAAAQHLADGTARAAALAGRPLNPLLEVRTENWGGERSRLPLDVFVTASQSLELGGKRAARLGVATAQHELAVAQLGLTDTQLVQRTAQAYIQALRARGHVETLRSNREGLGTIITSVSRRVEEGYSAEADLLRFETEASRLDVDIARATIEMERSLATLSTLIGAPVSVTAAELVEPAAIAVPDVATGSVAAAVRTHAEATAAAARVAQAAQLSVLEHTRRLPDPFITAGYKRTAGIDTAVVGVTMSLGVFDRNQSAIARSAAEHLAARADHDATIRRLAMEATAMVDAARTLSARAGQVAMTLVGPADVVRAAARATFREGTTDVLRLIEAERVYADVQRAVLDLRLDALAATIEARLSLGLEPLP